MQMRRKFHSWMLERQGALEEVAFDAMLAVILAAIATTGLRTVIGFL